MTKRPNSIPTYESLHSVNNSKGVDRYFDTVATVHGVLASVAQLKKERDEEHQRARISEVTGLPNKLAFAEELDARIASKDEFAVAFLDLDNFKKVNDRYGHNTGDAVLKGVGDLMRSGLELWNVEGAAIRNVIRPEDTAYHLSGDEFAVLLDMTPRQDTSLSPQDRIAEIESSLLVRIDNYATLSLSSEIGMRGSIGVAMYESGQTREEVLHNADAAMYEHKAAQRALYGDTGR